MVLKGLGGLVGLLLLVIAALAIYMAVSKKTIAVGGMCLPFGITPCADSAACSGFKCKMAENPEANPSA